MSPSATKLQSLFSSILLGEACYFTAFDGEAFEGETLVGETLVTLISSYQGLSSTIST